MIGVNFYFLTKYIGEYLRQHQHELARNEIDTQDALEEFILCESTIREDSIINYQVGICSKTTQNS